MENEFISYNDRSLDQITTQVFDRLAITTPELTDQNPSNPLVRGINVWAGIAEMLGYYLDFQARETFAQGVQLYRNAVRLARAYDYRVSAAQAASARIAFTFTNTGAAVSFAGLTIPANTIVATSGGIQFRTVEDLVIPAYPSNPPNPIVGYVDARQYTPTTQALGTSDGTVSQIFALPTNTDGLATVTVGGIVWGQVESFAFTSPSDQIVYQTVNEQRTPILEFGDGVTGAIPGIGDAVAASYDQTLGSGGNVLANTITTLVSAITVPVGFTLSVSNPSRATGGVDVEPLVLLRKRITWALRTQYRMVTEQDYIDVTNMHPQVLQTAVGFECGKNVDLYIVPNSGGIASSTLIASVQDYVDLRRMLTTNVVVRSAGEVLLSLSLNLRVLSNYSQSTTVQTVKDNLVAYFQPQNQEIGGTVHVSDIYEVIENTEGVDNSTITALVPQPYARPLLATTNPLNWTRNLLPTSTTTSVWRIGFTSSIAFQLFKDGNFVGNFTTGVLITQTEIEFIITGSYTAGDQYEFYTYPYSFTDLDLLEFSIPAMLDADIAINATGGI